MENRIKSYVNTAFEEAPNTKGVNDLKEEMISNLIDKYNDLVNSGKDEEKAYSIVVSGIGNVDRLIEDIDVKEPTEEDMNNKKKKALLTAIAIGLYIISPVMVIIADDIFGFENIGVILLLIFIAIATGILIYSSQVYSSKLERNDDLVTEFIDWKQNKSKVRSIRNSIGGFVWLIGTTLYFAISFTTMEWQVTWIIFLITGAVHILIDTVIKLVGMRYE